MRCGGGRGVVKCKRGCATVVAVGVVMCKRGCATVGVWVWLRVGVGVLMWRQRVVGSRRYVRGRKSELIGINQN